MLPTIVPDSRLVNNKDRPTPNDPANLKCHLSPVLVYPAGQEVATIATEAVPEVSEAISRRSPMGKAFGTVRGALKRCEPTELRCKEIWLNGVLRDLADTVFSKEATQLLSQVKKALATLTPASPGKATTKELQQGAPRYPSTSEPGVEFWAEKDHFGFWCVLSQAPGAPATEAQDDQFTSFKDADEIAQMLAKGEDLDCPKQSL